MEEIIFIILAVILIIIAGTQVPHIQDSISKPKKKIIYNSIVKYRPC
jgi:hypothetical protein